MKKRILILVCRKNFVILRADFIQFSLQTSERTGILADSASRADR